MPYGELSVVLARMDQNHRQNSAAKIMMALRGLNPASAGEPNRSRG
tara:strand:+ start:386 stop:523 length:138 start_codon:yes stop_codon:yes gene_type:complete